MLFAIRDDDTSYFTHVDELKNVYTNLWDRIPISLSVIPCDVKTYHRENRRKFFQESEPIPITENSPLIRFLRNSIRMGQLEVTLHGYDHRYKITRDGSMVPEFIWRNDLVSRIDKGKTLLDNALNINVTSFVPPSNAIDFKGLKAVTKAKLNLLGITGVRRLMKVNPMNLGLALASRLSKTYPYNVRQLIGHKQLICHSLTPKCDWPRLLSHFEDCREKGGTFVVAAHYWESEIKHNTEKYKLKDMLLNLIEKADAAGAKFVGVEEAFRSNQNLRSS